MNIKLIWKKPISILWDVDDPVVKFSNYSFIKQILTHQKLFTIGATSEKVEEQVIREGIKKSHVSELLAPDLFEPFLKSLII